MEAFLLLSTVIFAALYVEKFLSTKDINKKYSDIQKKNVELEVKLSLVENLLEVKRVKVAELYSKMQKLEDDNKILAGKVRIYQEKLQNIGKFLDKK